MLFGIALAQWSHNIYRDARIDEGVHLTAALSETDNNALSRIRAINHLQSLGHADAIESLRRFAASHPLDCLNRKTKIFNLDLVIPLLFAPKIDGAKLPVADVDHKNWQRTRNTYKLERSRWQTTVIYAGDIPFETNTLLRGRGLRFEKTYLIEWANLDGQLLGKRLSPSNDPFGVAKKLADELIVFELTETTEWYVEEGQDFETAIKNVLYDQVFELIRHLVPDFEPPRWRGWSHNGHKLRELISIVEQRGLLWSDSEQSYVFTK